MQRRSLRTQFLVFTLFGEYINPHPGRIWTSNLIALLDVLGVSERAVRSTFSRMTKKEWLVSKRKGRYSSYALTRSGQRVVREAQIRIFEPRRTAWDGLWHMVVYSVPEEKRKLRSALRKQLGWLGFGSLAPGTWISPNDRREEVEDHLDNLGARPYAVYFGGMKLNYATNEEVVARCWDLGNLNQEYESFLDTYEAGFKKDRDRKRRDIPLDPAKCFRQRFWLTLEYSQFPRRDPNLPESLLPESWLGVRASMMFTEYHSLLKQPAEKFVRDVLNSGPDAASVPESTRAG
jgi:phenylacetic acid degradation operon negative regulatory protein